MHKSNLHVCLSLSLSYKFIIFVGRYTYTYAIYLCRFMLTIWHSYMGLLAGWEPIMDPPAIRTPKLCGETLFTAKLTPFPNYVKAAERNWYVNPDIFRVCLTFSN